ncbi:hypothetical protein [Pseudomonas baetica]|uniref:hypothetical protein n=1 Tax=Pseudomonas baetica TaxID=674054 RepID=UPI002405FAE8|nr:hypothetical protein [Pseudomonas baetica]MDF9779257.1 hypothetical protein [Pseudomonas baetica]
MAYMEYDDPAHDADLAHERRRQLEADIPPEEAQAECGWLLDAREAINNEEDYT